MASWSGAHVLLWHNQLPDWLTTGVATGSISNTELRNLLHKHVTDEVTHFKGKIWQWDVANEVFTDTSPSTINYNDFWISNLGTGVIADTFRWAHQADPHALLFYNDYNTRGSVRRATRSTPSSSSYFARSADQWRRTADPPGHSVPVPDRSSRPAALRSARAEAGGDRSRRADPATRRSHRADRPDRRYIQSLQACLAVQACISYTVWGFGDAYSWVPGVFPGEGAADIYDATLKPKPSYYALQQTLSLATGAPHRTGTGARITAKIG